MAVICLILLLLEAVPVGAARGDTAPPGWQWTSYPGVTSASTAAKAARRVPSYSISYPPGWNAHRWPDTLAGYGQLDLSSSAGGTIDLILLPLRPSGPSSADLIAHDASFLVGATHDQVALPLGAAVRLAGLVRGVGIAAQILYMRRGSIVYRFFSSGAAVGAVLIQVAASLRIPAAPGKPAGAPSAPAQPPVSSCCHCPAWGAGWGTVLARLDGIPVYWNAGNVDNGCTGTYGILYQCVELVQRYFALRWGYPPIWSGVDAAADMRAHHPAGITFIPNGGSPGPRKGDALLFYGGVFGHVALVQRVDRRTGQIDVVEENWSPTGTASLAIFADNTIGIRNSAYGSYTVAGWLHSAKNDSPA
jgi:hypothetical protein